MDLLALGSSGKLFPTDLLEPCTHPLPPGILKTNYSPPGKISYLSMFRNQILSLTFDGLPLATNISLGDRLILVLPSMGSYNGVASHMFGVLRRKGACALITESCTFCVMPPNWKIHPSLDTFHTLAILVFFNLRKEGMKPIGVLPPTWILTEIDLFGGPLTFYPWLCLLPFYIMRKTRRRGCLCPIIHRGKFTICINTAAAALDGEFCLRDQYHSTDCSPLTDP